MSTESARKLAQALGKRFQWGNAGVTIAEGVIDEFSACQTVAPPPVVESKLVSPAQAPDSWAILINGQPIDYDEYEYSAQEKVRKIIQALGAAPAVSTPRCPKCGAEMSTMLVRTSINHTSAVKVHCKGESADELGFHEFILSTTRDFAQFFQPAPAQPFFPMATAPKDGTEVLLRVKMRAGIPGKYLVGHWMPGGHCIEDHPPIDSGWYFWNGCMFDKASEPIEWQPLPPVALPQG